MMIHVRDEDDDHVFVNPEMVASVEAPAGETHVNVYYLGGTDQYINFGSRAKRRAFLAQLGCHFPDRQPAAVTP